MSGVREGGWEECVCLVSGQERRVREERGMLGCCGVCTLFFSRIPVVVYVTCPAKWEIWKASFFFSGRFKRLFVTHWAKSFSAKEASVPVWWWCVQGGGRGGVSGRVAGREGW